MRWKAYFFLNPGTISSTKDIYGFKSAKNPPPGEELKEFENDMLKMIQSTKFKHINSPFLNKLKDNAIKIKEFLFASTLRNSTHPSAKTFSTKHLTSHPHMTTSPWTNGTS